MAALVDAGARHELPLEELDVYMRSMRIDCAPVRMASRSELDGYMDGSAAAVGRIMAPLLGAGGSADSFASLGQAFQLTNFIRDVREDFELDRIYLPGLDEAELATGTASAGFKQALAEQVGHARTLFREGAPALGAVQPRVRPGMRMARAVYVRVLDRVERLDYDVLGRRAGLAPWEVAGAAVGSLRRVTVRATLRGAERTPIEAPRADVLICGASFAGLAVARELAGSGADVLIVDRYEVGERQTSACAAPTPWLEAMGVAGAIRQEIPHMAFHTPHGTRATGCPGAGRRSTTAAVPSSCSPSATRGSRSRRSRAATSAATWSPTAACSRRPRSSTPWAGGACWPTDGYQPPEAPLSRGLEVHPDGGGTDLDVWVDRSLVRRGYCWSVPAEGEQRVGSGSYDPHQHVKEPTVELAGRLGVDAVRYQGNWFPHTPARRGRGRRLLRRRLGRPLLPAVGRGHPHGVLLRHRLRARAARRGGGRARARGRAASATAISAPATARRSPARSGCSA